MHQDLRLLVDKEGLEQWSKQFYPKRRPAILDSLDDRYPLVIFHGDVGTGKTATAEAAANALTTEMKKDAMLFKLSTRVRGSDIRIGCGNATRATALLGWTPVIPWKQTLRDVLEDWRGRMGAVAGQTRT